MRSLIIFSSLLVIMVQCGYPVIDYPSVPCYPIPSAYPHIPTYPSVPAPLSNGIEEESGFFVEGGATASEFRKRAKARSAHNRHFQRRSLQPIRRFKLKKQ